MAVGISSSKIARSRLLHRIISRRLLLIKSRYILDVNICLYLEHRTFPSLESHKSFSQLSHTRRSVSFIAMPGVHS
jgi:hypothetical protein